MGKPTGFLEFNRELPAKRLPQERVKDFKEFIERYSDENSTSNQPVVWIAVYHSATMDVRLETSFLSSTMPCMNRTGLTPTRF